MDYDNEEGFPGLYNADSGKRSNESDYSDGDHDKPSKKDLLIGRRKDKKDSKKDRGYAALEGESSPEEEAETKSPSKSKKTKAFKFPSKSKEKREKSRDKEKVTEKEVKEKEKEQLEKEKKKEKLKKEKEKRDKVKEKEKEKEEKKNKESKEKVKEKDKEKVKDKDKKERKASKQQPTIAAGIPFEEIFTLGVAQPIFGVTLGLAVERSRCHDDSNLPLVVRNCIDYLQEFGLKSDIIYRVEPSKQKIQNLKKLYNDREPVSENDYDIPTACFLLKLFLTELPEPILTTELCSQFEEVAMKTPEKLGTLIFQLPSSHKALLSWLIGHFTCLLSHDKVNKLNVQLLGTLLGQVLNMSTHLLSTLIINFRFLFPDIILAKYEPPLTSTSKLPDKADDIIKELRKQESLLNQIHAEMHAGFVTPNREEQLWEGQRIVTQLKRRLRSVQKTNESSSFSQTQVSIEEPQQTFDEDTTDKPSQSNAPQPIQTPAAEKVQITPAAVTVNAAVEKKAVSIPEKITPESDTNSKVPFPVGSFEDNFENFEDVSETIVTNPKNEMTDSIHSTGSESFAPKNEKPKLSDEELALMKLQLEHAEYLQLKSILQAKINSERFEIVKLRSHVAIKNKQENNLNQANLRDNSIQIMTEIDLEERQRLIRENAMLEQKRLLLANQIYQERLACIQLKIQLAMNEIL